MPEQKNRTSSSVRKRRSVPKSNSKSKIKPKPRTKSKPKSTAARRQEVRRMKFLIAALSAVILIAGCILIRHLLSPGSRGSVSGVSNEVLQYESAVEEACRDAGISQYSVLMLAIMQQESSGLGTDVFQCSECPFNTEYENVPNAITDPYYSIQVAAEYFAYCLKESGCKSIKNTERLKIALQDYNFGNDYAGWVLENYGTYTVENATEFSILMQNTLGWSSYGDPEYVEHVLRYFHI